VSGCQKDQLEVGVLLEGLSSSVRALCGPNAYSDREPLWKGVKVGAGAKSKPVIMDGASSTSMLVGDSVLGHGVARADDTAT